MYIPRLGATVAVKFVRQAIVKSIQELGYDRPRPDQAEAELKLTRHVYFTSNRKCQKHLLCLYAFSFRQAQASRRYLSLKHCSCVTDLCPDAGSSDEVYLAGNEGSIC